MAKRDSKAMVPRLRFPEFRGTKGWEKTPLSTLLDYERPEKYIVTDTAYLESGTPVLTANKSFVLGYTNETDGVYSSLPAIIFDDFTTDKKYVDFPFKVKSSAIKILQTKADDSLRLIFELMCGIKFDAKEHKRYYISEYQNLEIALPERPEQQKIADCLTLLDEVITAQGRKVEALKAHKRGLMQQLFPREGETRPRVRFPEFRNALEWSVTLLGELTLIVRGGSPRPIEEFLTHAKDGLNWLKIGDVDREAKYVTKTEERVRVEALAKTRVIHAGDFILSNSMSFGRPYISTIETCIHDGWIAVTEIPEDLSREFLYYSILSDKSQRYFANQAAGGGVQNLNKDIIKLLPLEIPPKEEQQRIAECLSSLDTQITAESHQLAALKTHKQGLMQQLFPAPPVASV